MSTNEPIAMVSSSVPMPKPHPSTEQPIVLRRIEVQDRTVHIQKISNQVRITPQARRYAISELARRAGFNDGVQKQWIVTVEEDRTVVLLSGSLKKAIIFPHAGPKLLHDLSAGRVTVTKRAWLAPPSSAINGLVPEFVIPFAMGGDRSFPLFVRRDENTVECTVDLPLSILLSLARWEEGLCSERDLHGRFAADHSVAYRHGFLQRPIVDEYGLAFEQAIEYLVPTRLLSPRTFRIKITHDADHIGIPFRLKNTLRYITHYRQPMHSAQDIVGLLSDAEPSDLRALREIVGFSLDRQLDTAVYWKASPPGVRDSGYDPRHRKIRRVINWLLEHNVESGVQPGYDTFRSIERLRREIQILREVLGDGPLGGRQHYLRWCPDTWIHWETCGLAYDSSLCFAEHIGFRGGTCIPYRPWLFSLNREADLIEIPLIVMDRTLLGYMKLDAEQSASVVEECVKRCRAVGGLFTLVWHNNNLFDPQYRSLYLRLLPLLQDGERYDWRSHYTEIIKAR